jgi:hypothetical protein
MNRLELWGRNSPTRVRLGILGFMLTIAILAILGANLSDHEMEQAAPAVGVPMVLLSSFLLISGIVKSRREKRETEQRAHLTLPLKRSFDVERGSFGPSTDGSHLTRIFNLLDTHLMLLGYRSLQRSDLVRTYTRGHRLMHLWHQDVRRWGTQLNIAIYDHGDRYRVNCYLDVESDFREPSQTKLAVLSAELADLQQVLNGHEVPSNSPIAVHA